MLIPLQHQRRVIPLDLMWPFSNACRWPYSYVYIMRLEKSSWIFMPQCNQMISMKWNTALLEGCLLSDTNLSLHIAHCIQIEGVQAWTSGLLQSNSLVKFEDTSLFEYAQTSWFLYSETLFWRCMSVAWQSHHALSTKMDTVHGHYDHSIIFQLH